jgi:hypothetical protein
MLSRPFQRERKELAPINWRRGLLRLWVLVSGAWMMGWLIYLVVELIVGHWSGRDILAVPVVLFGPPAAIIVMGIATRWAFRGFES